MTSPTRHTPSKISLTREVRFQVGPAGETSSPANTWAGWPATLQLVPYVSVRCTVSGTADPQTGFLCNVRELDVLLREVCPRLLQRAAQSERPPAELIRSIRDAVASGVPHGTALCRVEVLQTPFVILSIDEREPTMVQLTQQFEFSAAHRLHVPALSVDRNRELFGKCNNPHGHGHNYRFDVSLSCPQTDTGAIFPLPRLERIVREVVIERFDHKHLNEDVPEFRALNPTVENIAAVVWDLLEGKFDPAVLESICVYETPRTWARVTRQSRT